MKYLIITDLGFPMGGGESYMRQTCVELQEFATCYWLNFSSLGTGRHKSNQVVMKDYYTEIQSSAIDIDAQIRTIIRKIQPDLIHSQGPINHRVKVIAEELGIPCIIGYHFWTNFVDISSNINILKHPESPKISKNFGSDLDTTYEYVVSEFMEEVYKKAGGKKNLNIIYPLSNRDVFLFEGHKEDGYVLLMNMAELKGEKVFIECALKSPHIKFAGVITESIKEASSQYKEIKNLTTHHYTNPKILYKGARILIVPSLVDETFCRVAYEAVLNGIPVISTSNGFLKNLLGDSGVYLESSEFSSWISKNYYDDELLARIATAQKKHVESLVKGHETKFKELLKALAEKSSTKNIGIFCTWGDQGQGNHAHLFTRLLRSLGYKVHIFSFQSYFAINKSLITQKSSQNWSVPEHADTVYYSYNCREEVGIYELLQFCRSNKIRTLLFMEVVLQVNWDRLYRLKDLGYTIITVPLVEIVRADEVRNHDHFDMTLCCTHQAFDVMQSYEISNAKYIGHGYKNILNQELIEKKLDALKSREKIKFLHVAGHNPLHRKNTKKVIEAFRKALLIRDDIELTITTLVPPDPFVNGSLPDSIRIIHQSLPREAIEDLYLNHDVSIQVSSHEGLGLGFLESLQKITPVISLDGSPHNEFIMHKVNGLLIDCWKIPIADNELPIVNAWDFKLGDLVAAIVSIQKPIIKELMNNIIVSYDALYSEAVLLDKLNTSLSDLKNISEKKLFNGLPKEHDAVEVEKKETPDQPVSHFSDGPFIQLLKLILRYPLNFIDQLVSPITNSINRKIRLIIKEAMNEYGAIKPSSIEELNRNLKEISTELKSITKNNNK